MCLRSVAILIRCAALAVVGIEDRGRSYRACVIWRSWIHPVEARSFLIPVGVVTVARGDLGRRRACGQVSGTIVTELRDRPLTGRRERRADASLNHGSQIVARV